MSVPIPDVLIMARDARLDEHLNDNGIVLTGCQDYRIKTIFFHLTPDLLSDHLFRTVGRTMTSTPNMIMAYI